MKYSLEKPYMEGINELREIGLITDYSGVENFEPDKDDPSKLMHGHNTRLLQPAFLGILAIHRVQREDLKVAMLGHGAGGANYQVLEAGNKISVSSLGRTAYNAFLRCIQFLGSEKSSELAEKLPHETGIPAYSFHPDTLREYQLRNQDIFFLLQHDETIKRIHQYVGNLATVLDKQNLSCELAYDEIGALHFSLKDIFSTDERIQQLLNWLPQILTDRGTLFSNGSILASEERTQPVIPRYGYVRWKTAHASAFHGEMILGPESPIRERLGKKSGETFAVEFMNKELLRRNLYENVPTNVA